MKTFRKYSWNIYKYKMYDFMAGCLINVQHIAADTNAQARRQVTARMCS